MLINGHIMLMCPLIDKQTNEWMWFCAGMAAEKIWKKHLLASEVVKREYFFTLYTMLLAYFCSTRITKLCIQNSVAEKQKTSKGLRLC